MERLNPAENSHLLKENEALRRQFNTIVSNGPQPEYEDFIAALTIADIQRERINFLIKELQYVNIHLRF